MSTTARATTDASKLLTRFGETVQRIPEGKGVAEDVTAIVDLTKEQSDDERGKGYITRAELEIAAEQTVSREDQWLVHGRKLFVEMMSEPEAGLRTVHVVDRLKRGTTQGR